MSQDDETSLANFSITILIVATKYELTGLVYPPATVL